MRCALRFVAFGSFVASLAFGSTVASAAAITNGSFENPPPAGSPVFVTYTTSPRADWTYVANPNAFSDAGLLQGNFPTLTPATPDASPYWFTMRGNDAIYQNTGTVANNTTYTVNFTQSDQGNSTAGGVAVSIWAGIPGVGTLLDSITYAAVAEDAVVARSASLSSGTGFAGQNLYVQFKQDGPTIDNVLLDAVSLETGAAVPEPTSLGLLAIGSLIAMRRRHA